MGTDTERGTEIDTEIDTDIDTDIDMDIDRDMDKDTVMELEYFCYLYGAIVAIAPYRLPVTRAGHRSSENDSMNRQCRIQPSFFYQSFDNVGSSPSFLNRSFDNVGSSP
jgi:hypothetical protein